MTTAKKANERAEREGSGKGGISNEAGTSTGPGSSSATGDRGDNQREIGGSGSDKTAHNRPGHKANG